MWTTHKIVVRYRLAFFVATMNINFHSVVKTMPNVVGESGWPDSGKSISSIV